MKRRTPKKPTPERLSEWQEKWDIFCDVSYRVCYLAGMRFIRCFRSAVRFTRVLWRPIGHVVSRVTERLFGRYWQRIKQEYHLLRADFAKAGERVRNKNIGWLQQWLTLTILAVRRHRAVIRTAWNVAAPLVALVLLVGTLLYWNRAEFALLWERGGEKIGYIAGESDYVKAVAQVEGADKLDAFQVERAPKLSIRVADKDELMDDAAIYSTLLGYVDDTVVNATGLYVDGTFCGVLERETLKRLVASIPKEKSGEKASFFAQIEIVEGLYPLSAKVTEKEVRNVLAAVPIRNVTEMTTLKTLAYSTVIKEDPSQPMGYREVVTKGRNGKHQVTEEVITVDGKEQYRSVVRTEVVKAPVNQVVVVGARRYTEDAAVGDGKATGKFVWPLPYTKVISSPFASRWGSFHGAIDISNGSANGKPIIASDGGTVIEAEYHGSYGYYVLIDHGNGYMTRYAHCSKLMVEEGQKVAQGEYIANVGNTGYSFGAHLHFEIIKNGQLVDPLNYVQR